MQNLQGKAISELPLCGVISVSLVSNISLDDTFDTFKKLTKKTNGWKGITNHAERVKVLKHYNVKFREFHFKKRITLSYFVDQHTVKGKTYIVTTSNHIQVVKDGIVTDQTGSFPISKYWAKKQRLDATQIEIKTGSK